MEHDFDLSICFLVLLCLIAQLNTFFLKTLIVTSYKSIFHKRHAVLIRNYRKCYCCQIRDQWFGFRVQILFPHCEGYMLCWVKTVYCYFLLVNEDFQKGHVFCSPCEPTYWNENKCYCQSVGCPLCHLVCLEHDFDLSICFVALLCLIAQLNTFFLKTLIVKSYKSIFHRRHYAVLIRNYRKCYCCQIRDQWVGFILLNFLLYTNTFSQGYMLSWVKTLCIHFLLFGTIDQIIFYDQCMWKLIIKGVTYFFRCVQICLIVFIYFLLWIKRGIA